MNAPPKLTIALCKRCDTCMHSLHTGDGQVYDCRLHENLPRAPKSYMVCDDWEQEKIWPRAKKKKIVK